MTVIWKWQLTFQHSQTDSPGTGCWWKLIMLKLANRFIQSIKKFYFLHRVKKKKKSLSLGKTNILGFINHFWLKSNSSHAPSNQSRSKDSLHLLCKAQTSRPFLWKLREHVQSLSDTELLLILPKSLLWRPFKLFTFLLTHRFSNQIVSINSSIPNIFFQQRYSTKQKENNSQIFFSLLKYLSNFWTWVATWL